MAKTQDFTADNHGSIILLTPYTAAAREWCDENLPEDCQRLGNAYAIEHRYFGPIGFAIQDEFECDFRVEIS